MYCELTTRLREVRLDMPFKRKLTLSLENDGNDQTIDTQDTRHDNGYDGFEDKFWLEHSHAGNTDTTLSSSV